MGAIKTTFPQKNRYFSPHRLMVEKSYKNCLMTRILDLWSSITFDFFNRFTIVFFQNISLNFLREGSGLEIHISYHLVRKLGKTEIEIWQPCKNLTWWRKMEVIFWISDPKLVRNSHQKSKAKKKFKSGWPVLSIRLADFTFNLFPQTLYLR